MTPSDKGAAKVRKCPFAKLVKYAQYGRYHGNDCSIVTYQKLDDVREVLPIKL